MKKLLTSYHEYKALKYPSYLERPPLSYLAIQIRGYEATATQLKKRKVYNFIV
jgi:hypothetical protein